MRWKKKRKSSVPSWLQLWDKENLYYSCYVRSFGTGARFSKLPVITGPVKLFCFPFQMEWKWFCFPFQMGGLTVKFSAKETKWTSLEVRTHSTFLEISISKYDTGPVNLPGLSRNGPQDVCCIRRTNAPTNSRTHDTNKQTHARTKHEQTLSRTN